MSSVALKISASIAQAAREAALVADRSLTAQIEHWARLGMEVDEKLTGSAMQAIKRGRWETQATPRDQEEIRSYLSSLSVPGTATAVALASGFLKGQTTYSVEPTEPGVIVRTNPNGTRTRGKMRGKEFFPFRKRAKRSLLRCLIHGKSELIQTSIV